MTVTIDSEMYKQTHPDPRLSQNARLDGDKLDAKFMDREDPQLGDGFYMCLPTTVIGFNMQRKK